MVILARVFEFAAAHRLFRTDWSEAKNIEVFGKCGLPNSHGHNYRLEVEISGPVDAGTGMVLDANILESIVEEHVLNDLDHKNLDKDVPWLNGKISSVENISEAIWHRLEPHICSHRPGLKLHKLTLWETSKIYAIRTA